MLPPRLAHGLLIGLAAVWILFGITPPLLPNYEFKVVVELSTLVSAGSATLCMLIDSLVAGLRKRGWRRMLAALAVLVLAFPFSPIQSALTWTGAAIRVRLNEEEYERVALDALAQPAGMDQALEWRRDNGPPPRVVLWWSGFLDNWIGVVYDPSQTLESASEKVFGGDLVRRWHLWGPWYYVGFT